MIAGLPQAPSSYDPFRQPEIATNRRNQVLAALLNEGDIDQAQHDWAVKRGLNLKAGKLYKEIREPDFFGYVRDQLIAEYGAGTVRSGGLKVYTTIDPRFQRAAQAAIRETLYEPDDPAAGVISINPKNGAIRAMTAVIPGNTKNQFNLLSQGRRQSGSTFKTFVLTAAVEQGINPATTSYRSAPFYYKPDPNGSCEDGTWWCPETYDHSYTGWTTIERATLRSDNTVYAQLTLDVTPEAVAEMARKLGVRSPLTVDGGVVPSIGLGAMDVSPLDMASAYATLAAGGIYSEPMAIRKVILPDGEDTSAGWGKPKRTRVISDGVADTVTRILEENVDYGTGVGADYGQPAAGKTGTTEEWSDAWFCGYTPRLGTTVWVGYPKAKIPMTSVHGISVTGGSFPAQIWRLFMSSAIGQLEPSRLPGAGRRARVEGLRAGPVRTLLRLLRRRQRQRDDRDDRDRDHRDNARRDGARCAAGRPASATAASTAGDDRTGASTTARAAAAAAGRAASARATPAHSDHSLGEPRRAPRGGCGRAARRGLCCLRLDRGRSARPGRRGPGRTAAGSESSSSLSSSRRSPSISSALALLRRRPPGLRAVLLAAVAIQVIPLAGPLLLSTDAWTYWEYGRIAAVHDGNPYVDTPSEFSDDPSYEYAGAAWRDTTSVYGPAFTLLSGARRARLRVLCCCGRLDLQGAGRRSACSRALVLAARLARDRPPRRLWSAGTRSSRSTSRAAATTTPPGALVLGALALAAAGRRGLAGAAWAVAILLKWIPLSSSRCAQSKRAPPAGASTIAASPWPRPRARGACDLALRLRLAPRVRPACAKRRGADELRALAPGRAARRSPRSRSRAVGDRAGRRARVAGAGGRPRPRTPRALGLPAAGDDAVARALVHDLGAPARRRGGRPAGAADLARLLRVPPTADDSA